MSYSVIATPRFKKEAKRLIKKYPSLYWELQEFEKLVVSNPSEGTPLGQNAYKIRLAIKSKGKGKSGGARVITYVITKEEDIYLLTIYDKSELDTIDSSVIKSLISEINS